MNIICKIFGHKWQYTRTYIKICKRCQREEAVYMNRFPKIGEPLTYWDASPSQKTKKHLKE